MGHRHGEGQPDGHNPLLTARPPARHCLPSAPSLSPFPPNTPPRRHWLAGRANGGAVAGQGRAGPHVARGSRRARGNRSRRRARPVHVSGPCPCVRVPSVCPGFVRVSGRVRASPPRGSRHPHGQVRGGAGPVAAGQAAGPKTARFCLRIGAAAAPWRPGTCLGPGGRRQRCE